MLPNRIPTSSIPTFEMENSVVVMRRKRFSKHCSKEGCPKPFCSFERY